MSDRQYNSGEQRTGVTMLPQPSPTSHEPLVDPTASNNTPSTSSPLAKGLSETITTIIRDFDSQSQQTSLSQHHLSSSIDRLTRELDQLLADAPSPFIMQHAAKISALRKRVSSLNLVLKSIQRRVDNIDRLVSAGLPNDEKASGCPVEH